jgi:exopolysaccharide biosynthesis protein
MKKKGFNVSIYFIIGISLLLLVSFFLLKPSNQINPNQNINFDLQNLRTSSKLYVDNCLSQAAINAVDRFGLDDSEIDISYSIEHSLLDCLNNFEELKKQGYDVEYDEPKSSVIINENLVFIDLQFPIRIKKDNDIIEIKDFQFSFKKSLVVKTNNGVLNKGSTIYFGDGDFVINVNSDTNVISNNDFVDQIKIEMVDKHFDNLNNDVVVGNIVYKTYPEKIEFDNPIELSIRLKKTDIPIGYNYENLKIGWYDDKTDLWKTYKLIEIEQDDTHYYYKASVDHFTPVAIVACGNDEIGTYMIPMGNVYHSLIKPSNETFFLNNANEGHEIDENWKDGKHIVPELINYEEIISCEFNDDMFFDYEDQDEFSDIDRENFCNEILRDWDNDDDPSHVISYEQIRIKNNDAYESIDNSDDERVDQCINLCTKNSKETLIDEFEWLTNDNYDEFISGDSINDASLIYCDIDEEICIIEDNNLENKNSLGNVFSTMETYNGENRLGFYATPKTYGYATINDEINNVNGKGFFAFELSDNGDSCLDSLNQEDYQIGFFFEESKEFDELNDKNKYEFLTCSDDDECIWKLNDETNFEKENSDIKIDWPSSTTVGDIKSGLNVISVNVDNKNLNSQAYANAHLLLRGKGLIKWEQCGVTVQDRIDFLCNCDNTCPDILEYNCLNDIDEVLKKESLCDIEFDNECSVFNRISNLDENKFNPNGGFCSNDNKICPDTISEEHINCMCGNSEITETGFCCGQKFFSDIDSLIADDNFNDLNDCRQDYRINDQEITMSEEPYGPGGFATSTGQTNVGGDVTNLKIEIGEFKDIFLGVQIKKVDTSSESSVEGTVSNKIIYHVLKIDLDEEGIGLFVTPGEQDLSVTSNFLSTNQVQVAINGDGFQWGMDNTNTAGYAASNGKKYSKSEKYPTVIETNEGDVSIRIGNKLPANIKHAVSGFQTIVEKGDIVARFKNKDHADHKVGYDIQDPRTSVGINEENNELIIIVVDGRGISQGVDLKKLAELQIENGAYIAVNMDGGGSSTLVIDNNGQPAVLNTPSDGGERAVANHLGIFAKPVGEGGSSNEGGISENSGNEPADDGYTLNPLQVTSNIYRGPQPDLVDLEALKNQGFTDIFDTSTAYANWESGKLSSSSFEGINYHPNALSKYINNDVSTLKTATVGLANEIKNLNDQGKKIYVHCEYGVHRTGIAIAMYQRLYNGYSQEQAYNEMVEITEKYDGEGTWPEEYNYFFDVLE